MNAWLIVTHACTCEWQALIAHPVGTELCC